MKIVTSTKKNKLAELFSEAMPIEGTVEHKQSSIVEDLLVLMKNSGISRGELAEKMNVKPSRITKILKGTENLTIDTLVRLGDAVNAEFEQLYVSRDKKFKCIIFDEGAVHSKFKPLITESSSASYKATVTVQTSPQSYARIA